MSGLLFTLMFWEIVGSSVRAWRVEKKGVLVLGAPLVESEMSKLMITKMLELVLDPKCIEKAQQYLIWWALDSQACLSPELSFISLCVEPAVCSDQSCRWLLDSSVPLPTVGGEPQLSLPWEDVKIPLWLLWTFLEERKTRGWAFLGCSLVCLWFSAKVGFL